MNTILQRHFLAAHRAATLSAWWPDAEHRADRHAADCAALHIGIDAMSRVQAKRKPQAGCVASYPPLPAGDRYQRRDLIVTACRHRERMLGMPDTDDATWRRLWAVSSHYLEALV